MMPHSDISKQRKLDMCKFLAYVFVVCVQFLNICNKNVFTYFTKELMFMFHYYLFSVVSARYRISTVEKMGSFWMCSQCSYFQHQDLWINEALLCLWQEYGFTLETSLFFILVLCALVILHLQIGTVNWGLSYRYVKVVWWASDRLSFVVFGY